MHSSRSTSFFGMSMSQIIVIGELFNHNGCRQEELREYVFLDKASITRAVQQLQEYGLVQRQQDPVDRRAVRVYLTRKALAMESEMFVVASEWGHSLTAGFTQEERDIVINLLLRMEANAKAMVKNDHEQDNEE
jgi:DNA-binding MarR family transcriptional regulator